MNAKKIQIILLAVFAVIALSSPAIYASAGAAPKQCAGAEGKMEHKRQGLYKELGLSEEQKKVLEANKDKDREQTKALFAQMQDKSALLRLELQQDNLNMGKINQINAELKQVQAEMLDHRLQSILEVRKILTLEQFKKFSAKMETHKDHFKGKRWGGDR